MPGSPWSLCVTLKVLYKINFLPKISCWINVRRMCSCAANLRFTSIKALGKYQRRYNRTDLHNTKPIHVRRAGKTCRMSLSILSLECKWTNTQQGLACNIWLLVLLIGLSLIHIVSWESLLFFSLLLINSTPKHRANQKPISLTGTHIFLNTCVQHNHGSDK